MRYHRYGDFDPVNPRSSREWTVPINKPSRRRMAIINVHGTGTHIETLYSYGSGTIDPNSDASSNQNYHGIWFHQLSSIGLVHVALDLGYTDTVTRSDPTCTVTVNSNKVLDAAASTSDVGKMVSGGPIPFGSRITAVQAGVALFIDHIPAGSSNPTTTITVGPNPNNVDSEANKTGLASLSALFGPGNLLDDLGCRYDAAWFIGGSQGSMIISVFGQNYPDKIVGATMYAFTADLEVAHAGPVQDKVNLAYGQPTNQVGQVDWNGSVTGHPTIRRSDGVIVPAYYYGSSIKGQAGTPLAGKVLNPVHPPNMDIWRDRIIGVGKTVEVYQSTYDVYAGPNAASSVPIPYEPTHPTSVQYLTGSSDIWCDYVGITPFIYSTVDDHPGHSAGDPVHDGAFQFRDMPMDRITRAMLAAA